MDDLFQKRVRAAAIAGWWTLLIAVIFSALMGLMFLQLSKGPPEWLTRLWGNLTWEDVRHVFFWMLATFRLLIWLMFLVVVWLSIWSRKLRKAT